MKKRVFLLTVLLCSTMVFAAGCAKKENAEKESNTAGAVAGEEAIADAVIDTENILVGKYKGVEVAAAASQEVTEEDIQNELDQLLNSKGEMVEVTDRTEVQDGDTVNIDYKGLKDGVAFDGGTAAGYDLLIGSGSFIPGFEEQLIGAKVGEDTKLNLTFPENYPSKDVAGQDVVFEVKVNTIKKTELPELTDEFIKENTESETLDAYKEVIKTELEAERKDSAELEKQQNIWKTIVENSSVKQFPREEIDAYVKDYRAYMEQAATSYGMDFDAFLEGSGMTEEEFAAEAEEKAKAKIKEDFVYQAIAKQEGIIVSDEDYQDMLQQYIQGNGFQTEEEFWAECEAQGVEPDQMRESITNNVLFMQVIDFVTENAVEI